MSARKVTKAGAASAAPPAIPETMRAGVLAREAARMDAARRQPCASRMEADGTEVIVGLVGLRVLDAYIDPAGLPVLVLGLAVGPTEPLWYVGAWRDEEGNGPGALHVSRANGPVALSIFGGGR